MWEIKLEACNGDYYTFVKTSKEPTKVDNYTIKIDDIIIEFEDCIEEIKKI